VTAVFFFNVVCCDKTTEDMLFSQKNSLSGYHVLAELMSLAIRPVIYPLRGFLWFPPDVFEVLEVVRCCCFGDLHRDAASCQQIESLKVSHL